jgi:predicted Zn-dependent peptidase
VDRPGSTQTVLGLLAAAPSTRDPGLHGARLAALALGGTFTSRLNTRLREEKGYTYGVSAQLLPGPEHSLLSIRTAVQREPTADALRDLLDVTWGIREGPSDLEIQSARLARVTQLVSALESRSGMADSYASLWEAGREPTAFRDEIPALQAEDRDSVTLAAQRIVLEQAAVVVVGDLAAIRAEVEAAVPGDWAVMSPPTASSSGA